MNIWIAIVSIGLFMQVVGVIGYMKSTAVIESYETQIDYFRDKDGRETYRNFGPAFFRNYRIVERKKEKNNE